MKILVHLFIVLVVFSAVIGCKSKGTVHIQENTHHDATYEDNTYQEDNTYNDNTYQDSYDEPVDEVPQDVFEDDDEYDDGSSGGQDALDYY